jgi:hypothetical protein
VESFMSARKALHLFIDREIGSNDLVALVRTGGSLDGLQPFTMDRRVLHTAIDALRWNGFSRNGVEAFESINDTGLTSVDTHGSALNPTDFSAVNGFRSQMSTLGTLGALNLVTQNARDLPGRKAMCSCPTASSFRVPGPLPSSEKRWTARSIRRHGPAW